MDTAWDPPCCAHTHTYVEHACHSINTHHSQSSSEHRSMPGASATGAQPCLGVPATGHAAGQHAAASEARAKKKPPAVGVPLAMPSGFGLPFLPPPLLFLWMQQLAVQHSMAYMQQQMMLQQPIAPNGACAPASAPPPAPHAPWPMPPAPPSSCCGDTSLFGTIPVNAATMPPPSLPLASMPAFPPPPLLLPPLPPHMELPPPPPVPAELLDNKGTPQQEQERPVAAEQTLTSKSKHSNASGADDTVDAANKVRCPPTKACIVFGQRPQWSMGW